MVARLYSKGVLIECAGWLALGAALGYFLRDDVLRSTEQLFLRHELTEVFEEGAYLFDTEWLRILNREGWLDISPPLGAINEDQVAVAREVFASLLLMSSQFNRNPTAASTAAHLCFSSPGDLSNYLQTTVEPDEIGAAIALEQYDPSASESQRAAILYAGYGECIDFLDAFRGTAEYYVQLHPETIRAVIRKTAQLLRWRFFFFQSHTTEFEYLLEKYLDNLRVSDRDQRNAFSGYVNALCQYWAAYQAPLAAQMGT